MQGKPLQLVKQAKVHLELSVKLPQTASETA